MDRFTHCQYAFGRWNAYWCLDSSWRSSDLYREMAQLAEEGIPASAMQIRHFDFDRRGYHRLIIAFSADEQIAALVERQHQVWLAQKAIEDERHARQYDEARRNMEAQGAYDPDFEWE